MEQAQAATQEGGDEGHGVAVEAGLEGARAGDAAGAQSADEGDAVLVNEAGGVEGLVTVEDLVEEVVGELHSENEGVSRLFQTEDGGTLLIDGAAPVHDLNRALPVPLPLPLPESEAWTTVAGLVLALAGKVPRPGAKVQTEGGATLEVVEASPRKIHAVRWHPTPAGQAEGQDAGAT